MPYRRIVVCCSQVTLACGIFMSPARADWAETSLEYRCDKESDVFSLRGLVEANDEFFIPSRPGFSMVQPLKQTLKCKLKGATVSLEIFHVPPQERGMCSASSFYQIVKMTIGEKVLFRNEPFNHICITADPSLYEITVTTRGRKVHVESCTGKWDWEKAYSNSKCEAKLL